MYGVVADGVVAAVSFMRKFVVLNIGCVVVDCDDCCSDVGTGPVSESEMVVSSLGDVTEVSIVSDCVAKGLVSKDAAVFSDAIGFDVVTSFCIIPAELG